MASTIRGAGGGFNYLLGAVTSWVMAGRPRSAVPFSCYDRPGRATDRRRAAAVLADAPAAESARTGARGRGVDEASELRRDGPCAAEPSAVGPSLEPSRPADRRTQPVAARGRVRADLPRQAVQLRGHAAAARVARSAARRPPAQP